MHAPPLRTISACAAPPRVRLANIKGRLPIRSRARHCLALLRHAPHSEEGDACVAPTNDIGLRCIGSGSFGQDKARSLV
jgi:hypothetical protein